MENRKKQKWKTREIDNRKTGKWKVGKQGNPKSELEENVGMENRKMWKWKIRIGANSGV